MTVGGMLARDTRHNCCDGRHNFGLGVSVRLQQKQPVVATACAAVAIVVSCAPARLRVRLATRLRKVEIRPFQHSCMQQMEAFARPLGGYVRRCWIALRRVLH